MAKNIGVLSIYRKSPRKPTILFKTRLFLLCYWNLNPCLYRTELFEAVAQVTCIPLSKIETSNKPGKKTNSCLLAGKRTMTRLIVIGFL